jgi:hypothetical protein
VPEWTTPLCNSGCKQSKDFAADGGEHRLQGRMIATLDRGGHDVKAAKLFLKQLEAKHARHVADRDRLFKQVANHF